MCVTPSDPQLPSSILGLNAQEEEEGERIQSYLQTHIAVRLSNKWQSGSHPFPS